MKDLTKPCLDCPFYRRVKPGALGGSSVETYIGQSIGPFMLPCHKACDFDDPNWKDKVGETSQCAGAAIYRNNIGFGGAMPSGIHVLPQDHDKVFSSHAEFIAHHMGVTLYQAELILAQRPPFDMMMEQLNRRDNRIVKKGKP